MILLWLIAAAGVALLAWTLATVVRVVWFVFELAALAVDRLATGKGRYNDLQPR